MCVHVKCRINDYSVQNNEWLRGHCTNERTCVSNKQKPMFSSSLYVRFYLWKYKHLDPENYFSSCLSIGWNFEQNTEWRKLFIAWCVRLRCASSWYNVWTAGCWCQFPNCGLSALLAGSSTTYQGFVYLSFIASVSTAVFFYCCLQPLIRWIKLFNSWPTFSPYLYNRV